MKAQSGICISKITGVIFAHHLESLSAMRKKYMFWSNKWTDQMRNSVRVQTDEFWEEWFLEEISINLGDPLTLVIHRPCAVCQVKNNNMNRKVYVSVTAKWFSVKKFTDCFIQFFIFFWDFTHSQQHKWNGCQKCNKLSKCHIYFQNNENFLIFQIHSSDSMKQFILHIWID